MLKLNDPESNATTLSSLTNEERLCLLVDWLISPEHFPSRNRYFEEYKDPDFQVLTRRCRRLKGLVHDLRIAHPCPVACTLDPEGGWWFTFSFGFVKRDTRLDDEDVDLVIRALQGKEMLRPFVDAYQKAQR